MMHSVFIVAVGYALLIVIRRKESAEKRERQKRKQSSGEGRLCKKLEYKMVPVESTCMQLHNDGPVAASEGSSTTFRTDLVVYCALLGTEIFGR